MPYLKDAVTPTLLSGLREFWFEHLDGEDALILPSFEQMMRWFKGGKELDAICVDRYLPALDAIQASGIATGQELVDALELASPQDWLSLILLLDQIPRNCHRGDAAKLVFTVFDPLARDVANLAMDRGVPDTTPEIRWFFARRMWFYLPMMHSEDLATHERAVKEYQRMADDMDALLNNNSSSDDGCPHRAHAARVVQANEESARVMIENQVLFEKKHYDIIKQFGRYPHRNKAIGREMTAEEQKYLDDGGETFSG